MAHLSEGDRAESHARIGGPRNAGMTTTDELRRELARRDVRAVVVGGSAGAVDGLLRLLPALPPATAVPVLVVLHVSPRSGRRVSEIFADRTPLAVRDATDKDEARPGVVLFAPPDYHLLVERDGGIALSVDAPEHWSRPSIDVLFESASLAFGARLLAILLSGASEDGAAGLAAIRRAGGLAWVESPSTAESPIMPAAGLRKAPGARALTLPEMAEALAALPTTPRAGAAGGRA